MRMSHLPRVACFSTQASEEDLGGFGTHLVQQPARATDGDLRWPTVAARAIRRRRVDSAGLGHLQAHEALLAPLRAPAANEIEHARQ